MARNTSTIADTYSKSQNTDSSNMQMAIEKLNPHNYLNWAQSMKLIVTGKEKMGFLNGTSKRPSDAVAATKWDADNSTVMAWLIGSMQLEIGKTYLFFETAHEVWEAVKKAYSKGVMMVLCLNSVS